MSCLNLMCLYEQDDINDRDDLKSMSQKKKIKSCGHSTSWL